MSQKGVLVLKILISELYRFFSEFILIFTDLILFKKRQRGGFISPQDLWSGRGATWDPRGCDMARKATWQCHADPRECLRSADTWQGHTSPRGRPGGAT